MYVCVLYLISPFLCCSYASIHTPIQLQCQYSSPYVATHQHIHVLLQCTSHSCACPVFLLYGDPPTYLLIAIVVLYVWCACSATPPSSLAYCISLA